MERLEKLPAEERVDIATTVEAVFNAANSLTGRHREAAARAELYSYRAPVEQRFLGNHPDDGTPMYAYDVRPEHSLQRAMYYDAELRPYLRDYAAVKAQQDGLKVEQDAAVKALQGGEGVPGQGEEGGTREKMYSDLHTGSMAQEHPELLREGYAPPEFATRIRPPPEFGPEVAPRILHAHMHAQVCWA